MFYSNKRKVAALKTTEGTLFELRYICMLKAIGDVEFVLR